MTTPHSDRAGRWVLVCVVTGTICRRLVLAVYWSDLKQKGRMLPAIAAGKERGRSTIKYDEIFSYSLFLSFKNSNMPQAANEKEGNWDTPGPGRRTASPCTP